MKLEELRQRLQDGTLYEEPEQKYVLGVDRTSAEYGAILAISQSTSFSFTEVARVFKQFGGTARSVAKTVSELAKTAQQFNTSLEHAAKALKKLG